MYLTRNDLDHILDHLVSYTHIISCGLIYLVSYTYTGIKAVLIKVSYTYIISRYLILTLLIYVIRSSVHNEHGCLVA